MALVWRNGYAIRPDETKLFYEICGEGPPVVLCDGLFCSGHVWKYFVPEFHTRHQLIHWHYPGHGKSTSPGPGGNLSVARLGEDLIAVMDAAGVERAVLCGHSLVVQIVLETAWRYPKRVPGIALICGAPGRIVQTFHDSRTMAALLPVLGIGTRFLPAQAMNLWRLMPIQLIANLVKRSDEINKRLINMEDLKPYFDGMFQTSITVATQMLEQANHHDMLPLLPEIQVPALVIAGQKDRFTPSHRSIELANALPNSQIMISEEGTHSLPLEQPDLVNLTIKRFIATLQDFVSF